MSIEEKALRYDEVVERAKIEKEESRNLELLEFIDESFPELKESEDEMISKRIIALVNAHGQGLYKDKMLAWLEKQGKSNMSISEATKQELEDNLNKALEKETPESCNEFLEKQGEQKTADNKDYSVPLDIEIPFGAKDSELIQETIRIPDGCHAFIEGNEIVIKKEEPDWVSVKYLFVYKIIEGSSKGLPTEFLVNWKISNLENHLYLLYLTLEEDLYMEGYLHSVWVDYEGWNDVYIDVYRVEGMMDTKYTLIGKFWVIEGKMGYTPV